MRKWLLLVGPQKLTSQPCTMWLLPRPLLQYDRKCQAPKCYLIRNMESVVAILLFSKSENIMPPWAKKKVHAWHHLSLMANSIKYLLLLFPMLLRLKEIKYFPWGYRNNKGWNLDLHLGRGQGKGRSLKSPWLHHQAWAPYDPNPRVLPLRSEAHVKLEVNSICSLTDRKHFSITG